MTNVCDNIQYSATKAVCASTDEWDVDRVVFQKQYLSRCASISCNEAVSIFGH